MSGVRYYGGVFWGGLCPGKHLSGKGGLSGAVAPGEDVRGKKFVRQFQVTKMLFHVTLGRCWRGIYPVGFSGEGLFISYFGV